MARKIKSWYLRKKVPAIREQLVKQKQENDRLKNLIVEMKARELNR